jgi:hypothetical protein
MRPKPVVPGRYESITACTAGFPEPDWAAGKAGKATANASNVMNDAFMRYSILAGHNTPYPTKIMHPPHISFKQHPKNEPESQYLIFGYKYLNIFTICFCSQPDKITEPHHGGSLEVV